MSIIDHFESHLGPLAEGWPDSAVAGPIQVARFSNVPSSGVSTYATVGLGLHVLEMPDDRRVRQELILIAEPAFAEKDIVKFLLAAADSLLTKHHAVLRGEVIGDAKATPIVPGSSCTRVYAGIPVVFEESIQVYEGSSPATVIVWLIPITSQESAYVRERGWDAFESLLEESQPDLFDLARKSIV